MAPPRRRLAALLAQPLGEALLDARRALVGVARHPLDQLDELVGVVRRVRREDQLVAADE